MLTFWETLKSKTVWAAALGIAPEIWNMILASPAYQVPQHMVEVVTLLGGIFSIVFRVVNTQGTVKQ